jgi:hypothetical protein
MKYKLNFLCYWILVCSVFLGQQAYGQKTGDYRTGGSGNWYDRAIWQRYDGINWLSSLTPPPPTTDVITIQSAHKITIGGDQFLTANLIINGELTCSIGRFFCSNIITNNGTFTIGSSVEFLKNGDQPFFVNNGTFNCGSVNSEAVATIKIPWSNSGLFILNRGTLINNSVFTNTGILNFKPVENASIRSVFENMGIMNINAGTNLGGSGILINLNQLNLNVSLIVPVSVELRINNGPINGPGNITVNSPFVLSGIFDNDVDLILNNGFKLRGILRGSGALIVKGDIVWAGGELGRELTIAKNQTLNIRYENDFGPNVFQATFPLTINGTMTLVEGASIAVKSKLTNNGKIRLGESLFGFGIGSLSSFVNNGILEGGGLIDMPFTNTASGVIKGGGRNGAGFFLANTFVNKGTIEPGYSTSRGPGTLGMEGAQPLSSESTLLINIQKNSNAKVSNGQLLRKTGNLELAGKLKVIETGDVPDGSYRIVFLESYLNPGKLLGAFASVELPDRYQLNFSGTCVILEKITDICNGIDDDHDGKIDEDAILTTWYPDQDKDGFGCPNGSISSCLQPSGYVATNTDCNDNNPRINPAAVEVCNGVDDNCDGKVDDNCTLSIAAWPNPSTNDFQFSLSGDSNEPVKVTILDAAGVPLKKFNLFIGDENRFGQELRAGVYMIEAWQGSQRKVIKLVKF